jgi:hypothetical protein
MSQIYECPTCDEGGVFTVLILKHLVSEPHCISTLLSNTPLWYSKKIRKDSNSMKNSSFWKVNLLEWKHGYFTWTQTLYKAPLPRTVWRWGNYVHVFILPTDAWQKMKSQDRILQMLWKYAKFQISGSKVRNKNTVMKNQEQTKLRKHLLEFSLGSLCLPTSYLEMLKCTIL